MNLPVGVRFIDQLATPRALSAYVEFLRGQGYSNKTIGLRMGFLFSLLKANGVERSSKLIRLPKVQRIRTKAYNPEELAKLFSVMAPEEYLRYLFFLRTGCREQEVQFATWRDIDLKNLRFAVTDDGKADVEFVPKNHEERQVPLTTELGALLASIKSMPNQIAGFSRMETVSRRNLNVSGFEEIDPQSPLGGPDGTKDIICRKGGTLGSPLCTFRLAPFDSQHSKRNITLI